MSARVKILVALSVILGVTALAVPALMMTAFIGTNAGRNGSGGSYSFFDCAPSASTVTVEDLDEEQISNARTIVAVGKTLKVPPRGWVIAIATALQESGLRNLDHGDRDSRGMMQQRPSAGWGTSAQVQDPAYSARVFFGGRNSPTANAGLLAVRGWQRMPLWEAAQTVQRSAFPMAYADQEALATQIVQRLSGTTAGCESPRTGPWGSPVGAGYTLTSSYGWRTSPTRAGADFHTGQDFAQPAGSPVRAVTRGVVVFAGWGGSYGNLVRLRHANGVESWYAHLSATDATVGSRVRVGEQIGTVGSTGNSTGAHLHLEIRVDDQPTDPMPWLDQKGVRL
jgi:murein DD-endopeptidase MepM/ murein hydrolase activator NlpD